MKTIEYRTLDKSSWGAGAWLNEPDKKQWPDTATGLPCLAVRQPRLGHWCGYVGVPESHPYFGKDYDAPEVDVEVHGGLTFARACSPTSGEEHGICHKPGPGEPDHVWWLGFDCAHAWDLSPAIVARDRERGWEPLDEEVYRDLGYVESQCRSLALQIARANGTIKAA